MNVTRNVFVPVLVAVFLCIAAVGQETGGKKKSGSGLPAQIAESDQPVQIEADKLVVFQKESRIIFTGKVVLKRAPTTIRCRKLTALYRKKDWEVRKAVCEGNVRVVHRNTFAKCKKATFDNVKGVIIMEGSPVIYQGNQIFRGDLLKYFLKDERITGVNVRYQRNPSPPPVAPKAP